MDRLKLRGGQMFLTLEKERIYQVTNGTVLIYMATIDQNNQPGKRHFIKEINYEEKNVRIPSLLIHNLDIGHWCFMICALEQAILQCEEIQSTEQKNDVVLEFAKVIDLSIRTAEEFEFEIVEMIERKLVKEELAIFRNKQENDKEYKRGMELIYGNLKNQDSFVFEHTPNSLYNSVLTICKKMKINLCSYDMVVEKCGKNFTLEELARVSRFMIREIHLEQNWYKQDSGSFIAYKNMKEDDYCIPIACIPKSFKGYLEYNCVEGTKKIISEDVCCEYLKTAYMIYKPFPNRKIGLWDIVDFCKISVGTKDILKILAISFCSMLFGLWIPYLTQVLYDKYILWGDQIALLQIGLVAITFIIGNLLFVVIKKMMIFRTSNQIETTLQCAMFDRLFHMEEKVYSAHESSDLVRRAFSMAEIVAGILDGFIISVITNVFSIVYVVRMYLYSKSLSVVALFLILFSLVIQIIIAKKRVSYEDDMIELKTKESSIMYQAIKGISKIKISGSSNRILLKYLDITMLRKNLYEKKLSLIYGATILNGFLTIFYTIVLYYLWIMSTKEISIGEFLGFSASFTLFSVASQQMGNGYLKLKQVKPLMKRINLFLKTSPESEEGSQAVGRLEGEIEVNNISFKYNDEEGAVISNISFHIKKGEYIGIVGTSGSGKSTLLKLLLGFEKVSTGKIYYDNKDLDLLDKRELRKCLGVVLQDGQLIAGSIYDNIVIASTAVTKEDRKKEIEQVHDIINKVGLDKDIEQMPMGIETVIAEGAGTISGGQRQRILIARAIFNHPSIVYFDEATSALDNRNQSLISDNLERMNVTRVVIAHRLSTIINCDRLFVMENGKIIETGSYEELLKNKGFFYEMSLRQTI